MIEDAPLSDARLLTSVLCVKTMVVLLLIECALLSRIIRWDPKSSMGIHNTPWTTPAARETLLIVGVVSAPRNLKWRQAIRQTWFQLAPNLVYLHNSMSQNPKPIPEPCVLRFIIGDVVDLSTPRREQVQQNILETQLNQEAAQYGDVLRVPVLDSYAALIFKVLHFFDWCEMYSGLFYHYVMRVNDDTFVDIGTISYELAAGNLKNFNRKTGANHKAQYNTSAGHTGLYHGAIYIGRPIRHPSHKNFVSTSCYPWSLYPPYAHGPYYILSNDLVRRIVQNENSLRRSIITACGSLEDMQIGEATSFAEWAVWWILSDGVMV